MLLAREVSGAELSLHCNHPFAIRYQTWPDIEDGDPHKAFLHTGRQYWRMSCPESSCLHHIQLSVYPTRPGQANHINVLSIYAHHLRFHVPVWTRHDPVRAVFAPVRETLQASRYAPILLQGSVVGAAQALKSLTQSMSRLVETLRHPLLQCRRACGDGGVLQRPTHS